MPHTNNYSNIQQQPYIPYNAIIQQTQTQDIQTQHIHTYTHTYYFLARTRTRLAGLEDVVADGAERLRGPMVGLRRNPA